MTASQPVKGAGAVYSRAISECVSDADLSTSKHTFLCKPLEHDRYVHGEKPVSMESPDGQVFMKFSSVVCRRDDNPQVMPLALSSPVGRPAALGHARAVILW
jgi:hypothetical protein